MKRFLLFILICHLAPVSHIAKAQSRDPFIGVEGNANDESKPRIVTEAGKKTLEILRIEQLDKIILNPGDQQKGFEIIKAILTKHGITLRLKRNGEAQRKHEAGGTLAL